MSIWIKQLKKPVSDLKGYELIAWGTEPYINPKTFDYAHKLIPNRFDFGGDAPNVAYFDEVTYIGSSYFSRKNKNAQGS